MEYLSHYITHIGYFAYGLLFLIIFLESFPVTFFLPGDSLLFIGGFLAYKGHFNLPALILTFYVASILGYMFSYAMGQKLRDLILRSNDKYWFKKRHLEYTENFFAKYGNKTIVIGRFVPIVRSFAPTLAGAVHMNYRQFLKLAFFGGLLWTGIITSIGFYLGHVVPHAERFVAPLILIIIFTSLIPTIMEFIRSRKEKNKS